MGTVKSFKTLDMTKNTDRFSISNIEYLILNGDIKGAEDYIRDWGKETDSNVIRHFEHYLDKYKVGLCILYK